MESDNDGSGNASDVGYDESNSKFCSACILPLDSAMEFEKVLNFDDVGIAIYRRLEKIKQMSQATKGKKMGAFKTVIVRNISDADIISEDIIQEIQKRDIACNRCRHIIELALKLLQKVPALNKKAIISICDYCKRKDSCHNCKESTKSFLSKYKGRSKKQISERINKWERVAKYSYLDKKAVKPLKKSESALRIETLSRQERAKTERNIDISDLCRQAPQSTKSMPAISKDKKYLQSDQRFVEKSSSDSKITELISLLAPEDSKFSDFEDNFKISKGIVSHDTISKRPGPAYEIQKHKHHGKHEDDDLFPDHRTPYAQREQDDEFPKHRTSYPQHEADDIIPKLPTPYAHEREKDFQVKFDVDEIDYKHSSVAQKKTAKVKKKYVQKPGDRMLISHKELPPDKRDGPEAYSILKKDITKPARKLKLSGDKTPKGFIYSFPFDSIKSKKEYKTENAEKSSVELIKEVKERSDDIKRKTTKIYLPKDNKLDRKLTQKKERQIAEKLAATERARIALEKMNVTKKGEQGLTENIINGKKILPHELKEHEQAGKSFTSGNKMKTEEDQLKSKSNSQQKEITHLIGDKETALLKKEKDEMLSIKEKEIALLQKQKEGTLSEKEAGGTISKPEKEGALLKKDKENALSKNINEKALLGKKKDKENNELKDEDYFRKNKKSSDKQQKENNDNMIFKLGNENKKTQTHRDQEESALRDMIKKSKDTAQLARKQKLNEQKRDDAAMLKKDKKSKETKINKMNKELTNLEIRLDKIKVSSPKSNEILVAFKEQGMGSKYLYNGKTLRDHWTIHEKCHKVIKDRLCPLCRHSDLELTNQTNLRKKHAPTECIKGQKIVDINELDKGDIEKQKEPLLFATTYKIPPFFSGHNEKKLTKPETVNQGQVAMNGSINYVLSDRTFIDKGWTVLPTEKVMRKMNVYRMRPAKPEFDWFHRNKEKPQLFYEDGELFAQNEDGRCRWYYRNQRLALDYYNAEEINAQQRFVIYSNGEPDERGRARPYTILATFDHLGNGVVFDHGGKIRLKYNQTEGVVLDRNIGPVSHWKWHTLNDPPELQQVMIDTKISHIDRDILALGRSSEGDKPAMNALTDERLAIEFDNVVKEKSKKLRQNFKPFQIKMKAMKINENFSLKVLDQANVYLIYRDGTTNIKLNLGMLLDHTEIVDTDTVELGEVHCNLERLPARTSSLAELQACVGHAKHHERALREHEQRLRWPGPRFSVDKLAAAVSCPLRLPLCALNSSTATSATPLTSCPMKRMLTNNVYYSTM